MITYQIHDFSFETVITSYKTNWKKLWSLISNQLNVEEWNWKKNQLKKEEENLTLVNLSNP
jgi:hypothetical protein